MANIKNDIQRAQKMKKTLKTWVVISIVISAIVVGAIIENVTTLSV